MIFYTFLQVFFPVPQFRSQAHTSHYTYTGPGATFGGSAGMARVDSIHVLESPEVV